MNIIKRKGGNISDEMVSSAVEVLKNGGIVVLPADTCYGISCAISNKEAVRKLFDIKEREHNKPVSIALDFSMLKDYVDINEIQEEKIKKLFPGRYTVIVKKKDSVGEFITGGMEKVGVRIMDDELHQRIIEALGEPIVTTSANLAGRVVKYDSLDVIQELDNDKIDLIFDYGKIEKNDPSKVIVIDEEGNEEVLRV